MPPSALTSSVNWPQYTPYGNHAPKPANPSNHAALAMSAG